MDKLNHASIIEGARLSFAKQYKYAHNDMEALEKYLENCESDKIKLIVADGVLVWREKLKLPEMVKLAKNTMLL